MRWAKLAMDRISQMSQFTQDSPGFQCYVLANFSKLPQCPGFPLIAIIITIKGKGGGGGVSQSVPVLQRKKIGTLIKSLSRSL